MRLRADVGGARRPVVAELLLQRQVPLLHDRVHSVALRHVDQRIRRRTALAAGGKRIRERQVRQEWRRGLARQRELKAGTRAPRRVEDVLVRADEARDEVVVNAPAAADDASCCRRTADKANPKRGPKLFLSVM